MLLTHYYKNNLIRDLWISKCRKTFVTVLKYPVNHVNPVKLLYL